MQFITPLLSIKFINFKRARSSLIKLLHCCFIFFIIFSTNDCHYFVNSVAKLMTFDCAKNHEKDQTEKVIYKLINKESY